MDYAEAKIRICPKNCFFPNDNYSELMSLLGVGDTSFITEIYENKTHSMMSRSESFVERAFAGI